MVIKVLKNIEFNKIKYHTKKLNNSKFIKSDENSQQNNTYNFFMDILLLYKQP